MLGFGLFRTMKRRVKGLGSLITSGLMVETIWFVVFFFSNESFILIALQIHWDDPEKAIDAFVECA